MARQKNPVDRTTSQRSHQRKDCDELKHRIIVQYIAEIDRRNLTRAELTEALATKMYENRAQVQEPKNPRDAGVTPFFLGQVAGCIQFERMLRGQGFLRPVELRKRLDRLRETLTLLLPAGSQGLPHLREFTKQLNRQTVERWCREIKEKAADPALTEGINFQITELKRCIPEVFEELIK